MLRWVRITINYPHEACFPKEHTRWAYGTALRAERGTDDDPSGQPEGTREQGSRGSVRAVLPRRGRPDDDPRVGDDPADRRAADRGPVAGSGPRLGGHRLPHLGRLDRRVRGQAVPGA